MVLINSQTSKSMTSSWILLHISNYTFNPLATNASHHIETSPLICIANQLTVFCMTGTSFVNGLCIS